MKYIILLSILLSPVVIADTDDFVEIVTEPFQSNSIPNYPTIEVGAPETQTEFSNALTSMPTTPSANVNTDVTKRFVLTQGLLKGNIERMTAEFLPSYSIVWQADQRIEQYADLTISGSGYYDLLNQVVKQYGIGACVRANDVIEIYNIQNNRFYCED
jgi:hypothetical protein